MKRHAFDQKDVHGDNRSWLVRESRWQRFQRVYKQFGFTVRVTGGNFLTHEIDGSKEDFETILDLMEL